MSFFKKDNQKEINEHDEVERRIEQERKMLEGMRKIVILTDGNNIALEKAEVSGALELTAVLQSVMAAIKSGTIRITPVTLLSVENPNEPQMVDKKGEPKKPDDETNNK